MKKYRNGKKFVAVNYIKCSTAYTERFEQLFATRTYAIDTMPGFLVMHVLKPTKDDDRFLIVSYWDSEAAFKAWTGSSAFIEGHKRGFADLAQAKAEGREAPMSSEFKTYSIISN